VPVPAIATDPDDEDTLHPEDNVRLPDEIAAAPPAEVTRVLSAAEVAQALEQAQREAGSGEDHAPDLTVQHPAVVPIPPPESETADEGAHGAEDETEPEAEAEKASPLRIAIALLVIVVLAALIVLLVLNALPR
jgi:hypothetical protein